MGDIIWPALGLTAPLVMLTLLIAVSLGTLVGLIAAASFGGPLDRVLQSGLSLLLSCPPFFLGLLLILGRALAWGVLPVGGWAGTWPDNLRYLLLPSLALSGFLLPQFARVVRQAAHAARSQLWYQAALGRGLGTTALWVSHVLRNRLLPVVALVGVNIGPLVGSAVIVEAVFGLPGLGQELITAVDLRDYPVIQGIALVTAILVAASGVAADAVGKVVDPRTRRA